MKHALHTMGIAAAAMLSFGFTASAAVLQVPTQYPTIQAAIAAAKAKDLIRVAQGTYRENLTLKPDLTLEGGWKADFSARNWKDWPSIVDGGASASVIKCANNVVVDGFTIQNGKSAYGGGIDCQNANATLVNNTVLNNNATRGGGISIRGGEVHIRKNTVLNNTATSGGGMSVDSVTPTRASEIEDNTIHRNKASSAGGGLYVLGAIPNTQFVHNSINENTAGTQGGGAYINAAAGVLSRNFVFGNTATGGGGLWLKSGPGATPFKLVNNLIDSNVAQSLGGGGVHIEYGEEQLFLNNTIIRNTAPVLKGAGLFAAGTTTVVLKNNIIWANKNDGLRLTSPSGSYISYNDIQDGTSGGQCNLSEDPLFGPGGYDLTPDSPVVNAGHSGGAPGDDFTGVKRDSRPDMGAIEFIGDPYRGHEKSLQSLNFPKKYVRHRNFRGELTEIATDLDNLDATFKVVAGLADNQQVSFESKNFPGHYLRHSNFELRLDNNDGSDLFKKDATFKLAAPQAAGACPVWSSFPSLNYPDRFIRHSNFLLYLQAGSGEPFGSDATFRLVAPKAP
jgi:hypothetical protein